MSEDKQPKHTKEELKQMQLLPLAAKVSMTQARVREWVREYGESGVYISFSGGKDSTVLLHIVRELYPDTEAVFIDTGLEYPEIRKFVKTFDNVTILRPEMRFDEVIKKYGYPMLSKTIAHNVKVAKYNPHGKVKENIFSELKRGPYAMNKWIDLLEVDFDICEKCCDITKKKPARAYEKRTGKKPILATMAAESKMREDHWLKTVAMLMIIKTPKAAPYPFGQRKISCNISKSIISQSQAFMGMLSLRKTTNRHELRLNAAVTSFAQQAATERVVFSAASAHTSKKVKLALNGSKEPTRSNMPTVWAAANMTNVACGFRTNKAWE